MSQINVNTIRNRTGGAPSLDKGAVVTGIVTATTGQFAGDVTIGGVLTYEDVTNIDSTGIVTAKGGIRVGNPVSPGIGATIDPNGNAEFAGISTLGGNVRIGSGTPSGKLHIGPIGSGDIVAELTSDSPTFTYRNGSGAWFHAGKHPSQDAFIISDGANTTANERLRVGSAGQIGLGGANYGTSGQVITSAGSGSAPTWSAIPAGGNVIVAEAEGSIANDKAVQIRTDGKVEQIKATVTERTTQENSITSPDVNQNFNSVGGARRAGNSSGIAWSTTQEVGVFVYKEAQSSPYRLRVQAYDYRGGSNSLQLYSDVAMTNYRVEMPKAAWDSTNDKIVVAWKRDSDDNARFSYTSPSSSSGTRQNISGNDNELYGASMDMLQMCFVGNGRCMACWKRSNVNDAQVRILSWDSSSQDYVKTTDYNSSNSNISDPDVAYDAAGDRVILVYIDDANNNNGRIKVGQITGTGTSANPNFGAEITFSTATSDRPRVLVDPTTGKVIIIYYNIDAGTWYGVVGTLSGTNSITMGTPVELDSQAGRGDWTDTGYLTYMASQNCVYAHYIAQRSGGGSWYYVKSAKLTTSSSDNSLTISNILYLSSGSNNIIVGMACAAVLPDTVENKIMLFGRNDGNSEYAAYKQQFITSSQSNLTQGRHYLGYADQAYTDGQIATIKTYGNNVDTLSGLTIGSKYWVLGDGTVTTTQQSGAPAALAGLAIGTNKLLIREPNGWAT